MSGFTFQNRSIGAVIFDHDGVLVDSELLAMELINQLLNKNGIDSTVDEAFSHHLGRGFESVTERVLGVNPELDHAVITVEFHQDLFAAFEKSLTSIPGIIELLEVLRGSGIPIAIGSSGTRERVELGIRLASISDYFPSECIITRENVSRGKPDPDIFLLAAERLGVRPENCLVIEDSPHGIDAAQRAGMKVVGLTLRTSQESLINADALVGDATGILKLISQEHVTRNVCESA